MIMVVCQMCGLKEGEWQCSVCQRIVCTDHAVPTSDGVFCTDHSPQKEVQTQTQEKKREQSSGARNLRSLFITLLALTVGLGLIVMIGQSFVDAMDFPGSIVGPFASAIRAGGMLIVGGIGAFTALIGLAWLVARRSRV